MVNDISSGDMDEEMIDLVSKERVPFICTHMQGTPQTMQKNPYYQHVTKEVIEYFIKKVSDCKQAGITDILIDPGFGFGKTVSHNYQLLKELNSFTMLNCPILVGLSRKSMISKVLEIEANEALNGTTVLHTLALQQGANILRVHDVKEAHQTIQLVEAYKNAVHI
jgi:dihydropteroate synthase